MISIKRSYSKYYTLVDVAADRPTSMCRRDARQNSGSVANLELARACVKRAS